MDAHDKKYMEYKWDSEELRSLLKLAKDRGFDSIEAAITAHDATPVAYMHDGENRFDVIHVKVKEVWDGAKPNHVEHYTIPLIKKVTT